MTFEYIAAGITLGVFAWAGGLAGYVLGRDRALKELSAEIEAARACLRATEAMSRAYLRLEVDREKFVLPDSQFPRTPFN
jgi:hypothetical protein